MNIFSATGDLDDFNAERSVFWIINYGKASPGKHKSRSVFKDQKIPKTDCVCLYSHS